VIFWAFVRFRLLLWTLRTAGRLLKWLVTAAVLVAAAPVTVVTAAGLAGAWLRGWPPARLRRAALLALPMTAVYLAVRAARARTVHAALWAPVHDWQHAWHLAQAGRIWAAAVLTAPVAIPAGLAAAAGLWAWRIYAIETGLSGRTATAPVVFDARQWRRAARTARARVTAPGPFPLATGDGRIVMGATIRAVGHRWRPVLAVPYQAMGRHQVIIGSSGSGKTNLMMRTWAGWYAAALQASRQGAPRPLLVVLDCKGGPDARVKAERTRRLLHAAGAGRVAVWPDEAAVSLWALPPAAARGAVDADRGRYRVAAGRAARHIGSRCHQRSHEGGARRWSRSNCGRTAGRRTAWAGSAWPAAGGRAAGIRAGSAGKRRQASCPTR
jgi:hypothetical protein